MSQLPHWVRRYLVPQFNKRVLRRKYLSIWGPRYRGIQDDLKTVDQLTVIARQWSVCSMRAEKAIASLEQGEVLRLKYEDFVDDPVSDLERICAHCGLEMSSDMEKATREMVKSDRKAKWQRFDPQDLARIIPEISGEMRRHGYEIPTEITQSIENLQGNDGSSWQFALGERKTERSPSPIEK
jgi:hypothetical protein